MYKCWECQNRFCTVFALYIILNKVYFWKKDLKRTHTWFLVFLILKMVHIADSGSAKWVAHNWLQSPQTPSEIHSLCSNFHSMRSTILALFAQLWHSNGTDRLLKEGCRPLDMRHKWAHLQTAYSHTVSMSYLHLSVAECKCNFRFSKADVIEMHDICTMTCS